MSRIIFFIVLIAAAIWLLRRLHKSMDKPADKPSNPNTITDDMVVCTRCGVHLPKQESVQADGQFYCCAAHRDGAS